MKLTHSAIIGIQLVQVSCDHCQLHETMMMKLKKLHHKLPIIKYCVKFVSYTENWFLRELTGKTETCIYGIHVDQQVRLKLYEHPPT